MQPQWITSMEVFAPMIMPVLHLVKPKVIGEIGAAEGGNTRRLYEFQKQTQGKLLTVDPFPRGSFTDWVKASSDVVTHFADFSLNCIPKMGAVDVWFVDGDHNWYTVLNELTSINQSAQQYNIPALIFMHDVGWPCGRRDMYYNPAHIPQEFMQPNSNELGITLEKHAVLQGGLKGPYWALQDGGPRNGVLTAVEDFLQQTTTPYFWFAIPAILGLGVLIAQSHPMAALIAEFYRPYHNNPLMQLIEQDRVSHYLMAAKLSNELKNLMPHPVNE